ncbi:MAG: heme-copper oxidase subunit III [Verrucomicrobia bacterium]|nr:MAG: heme-copper oxidase subunit III [Verrucomicrobiota bacterium]
MEIPYTDKARPDTGLYNAKVGIWLFLASEIMLFGALFSSYILLRVQAPLGDWPAMRLGWPHGLLNIPIGTFNTAVLITSSVTVVMAWASLKMGKLAAFRRYMVVTLVCAFGFLGVKSYEYNEKFTHYELRLKSGEVYTGHLAVNGKHPGFWSLSDIWNLDRLNKEKVATVEFVADPKKESHGAKHAEASHEHVTLKPKVADIAHLDAFIPRNHPFFAIYFTITALHGLHVLGGALVMGYFAFPGSRMWKTKPEQFTNRIEVVGLFWHFVDLVWIFLFPVVYLL